MNVDQSTDATVAAYQAEMYRLRVAVYAFVMDVTRCHPTVKNWETHRVLLETLRGTETPDA